MNAFQETFKLIAAIEAACGCTAFISASKIGTTPYLDVRLYWEDPKPDKGVISIPVNNGVTSIVILSEINAPARVPLIDAVNLIGVEEREEIYNLLFYIEYQQDGARIEVNLKTNTSLIFHASWKNDSVMQEVTNTAMGLPPDEEARIIELMIGEMTDIHSNKTQ